MIILNNLLKNLFESKRQEQVITTLSNKDLIITIGSWCPNCKEDGAVFYYNSSYDNNLKFRPAIYICENCCKNWEEEEYNRLILIAQRKQKLDKINESR